jgi:integrase
VKPIDLQQIMNSMDGYSDDYIKKVYEYINDIFSKAVDNDLILKNPMRSVVRPTGGKESHRDITEQERDALLALGKQKHEYLYFLLMYYCGCRPAEAGSVLGGDIKDGFLHIRGTKTSKADRYVPIPNSLQAYMEKRVSPGVNIVTREKGPMSVYDRRKLWKAFQADIDEYLLQQTGRGKAKDLVPYCFRHAYCCTLLRANIPLRTAMTLMGHTDYKMILTVYQHTDDKMLDEAADLINAVV